MENVNQKWIDKIETIKQADEKSCIDLTDWERDFIDSMDAQTSKPDSKPLSWKQTKCINSIYERIE